MAGDWLPVRLNLKDDPAVIAISTAVGLEDYAVVGRLVALWSWANQHSEDGTISAAVTAEWVDRFLSCPGFATAMIAAGWLILDGGESGRISFPAFHVWNSDGAKSRLKRTLDRRRQRGQSVADLSPKTATSVAGVSPKNGDESATTEQNRTEENKTPHTPRGAGGGGGPNPGVALAAFDPEANPIALPFARLLDAWAAAGLTGGSNLAATATRRGRWQHRLADPEWAARWAEAVARAGRSARCRGTAEWRLTIDAFLKEPDFVCRLLEGEFDTAGESGIPRPSFEAFEKRYG